MDGIKAGMAALMQYANEIDDGIAAADFSRQRNIVPDVAFHHIHLGQQDQVLGPLSSAREHFDAITRGIQPVDDS